MAVPQPLVESMDQHHPMDSNNKKRTRRTNRSRKNVAVVNHQKNAGSDGEGSSSSGSSSSSPSTKPRRRRNRKSTTGSKHPQPPVVQLTAEEQAQYVAMDCEMVGVGLLGRTSAIARVTLVDWNGNVVFDEYVQPDRPVTDYRTFVSGIIKEDLETAMDLDTCRAKVMQVLEDKILVGHGLKNDLRALDIQHPWQRMRDTAKYESFMQVRFDDGILWPRKLRDLVYEKLHREIQVPGQPHSPVEDAMAALDLYKLVRTKFERIMDYKIQKTREIEQQKQQHVVQNE